MRTAEHAPLRRIVAPALIVLALLSPLLRQMTCPTEEEMEVL
jgi:hypothetical protein